MYTPYLFLFLGEYTYILRVFILLAYLMGGEAPSYAQQEAPEAPQTPEQPILPIENPNQNLIDSFQDDRAKAQAEFAVNLIQQQKGSSPLNSKALEETVKLIVSRGIFKEPPLPTMEEAMQAPLAVMIETVYDNKVIKVNKETANNAALAIKQEQLAADKQNQEQDKRNQEAISKGVKDIEDGYKKMSADKHIDSLLNGVDCKSYVAKAQADTNDEIMKNIP